MLGFVSIPGLSVVVGFESERDVDLDLLRIIRYRTYSGFSFGPETRIGVTCLRSVVRVIARVVVP